MSASHFLATVLTVVIGLSKLVSVLSTFDSVLEPIMKMKQNLNRLCNNKRGL